MYDQMVGGITMTDLKLSKVNDVLVTNPMPNMYFTRDPFSCVGDGVIISHMKYDIRKPETLFGEFIFKFHPMYKGMKLYISRNEKGVETIEGGDIFVYTNKTLVIGVSERTTEASIKVLANNLKKSGSTKFEQIIAIYVPHKKNLMHLDT